MIIGGIKVNNLFFLAPMAGINDLAFRILCKKKGAGLLFTEMVSANAAVHVSKKTLAKIRLHKDEHPIVIQLFGGMPEPMVKTAIRAEKYADAIDINMGCPVRKVGRCGAGVRLMRDPKRAAEIVSGIKDVVSIPVWAKIRAGPGKANIAVEFARALEKAGVDAITVHPRTQAQGYSGHSNWQIIKDVKESVSVDVIGNGDVVDGPSAEKMFESTECDAIMIGRAAITNPSVFTNILNYFKEGSITPPQKGLDKLKDFYQYHEYFKKYGGHYEGLKIHAIHFTKYMRRSSRLRQKLGLCKSDNDILKVLKEYTLQEEKMALERIINLEKNNTL